MINNRSAVNVKDVNSKEFIKQFAKYLKNGNKIKIPDVLSLPSTI